MFKLPFSAAKVRSLVSFRVLPARNSGSDTAWTARFVIPLAVVCHQLTAEKELSIEVACDRSIGRRTFDWIGGTSETCFPATVWPRFSCFSFTLVIWYSALRQELGNTHFESCLFLEKCLAVRPRSCVKLRATRRKHRRGEYVW